MSSSMSGSPNHSSSGTQLTRSSHAAARSGTQTLLAADAEETLEGAGGGGAGFASRCRLNRGGSTAARKADRRQEERRRSDGRVEQHFFIRVCRPLDWPPCYRMPRAVAVVCAGACAE